MVIALFDRANGALTRPRLIQPQVSTPFRFQGPTIHSPFNDRCPHYDWLAAVVVDTPVRPGGHPFRGLDVFFLKNVRGGSWQPYSSTLDSSVASFVQALLSRSVRVQPRVDHLLVLTPHPPRE